MARFLFLHHPLSNFLKRFQRSRFMALFRFLLVFPQGFVLSNEEGFIQLMSHKLQLFCFNSPSLGVASLRQVATRCVKFFLSIKTVKSQITFPFIYFFGLTKLHSAFFSRLPQSLIHVFSFSSLITYSQLLSGRPGVFILFILISLRGQEGKERNVHIHDICIARDFFF